jgi:hypothetical protein
LNRTDADVSIFFLNSNSLAHTSPVHDPFFSANIPFIVPTKAGNVTVYTPDNLTSIMACTDQFQYQNPEINTASELTSALQAGVQALQLSLNTAQSATVIRLGMAFYESLLYNSVNGLGAAALLAQDNSFGVISPGLPDDQWREEVKGWFNVSLATLQDRLVSFASKSMERTESFARLDMPADMPNLSSMCVNQVIRNVGAYQTFSVLGIGVIVGVGVFIIVISWQLEFLFGCFLRKCGRTGEVSWSSDSILQVQRMAFQGKERGGEWDKCDGEIPVTRRGEEFKALGVEYEITEYAHAKGESISNRFVEQDS